jgi:hypothetical protein
LSVGSVQLTVAWPSLVKVVALTMAEAAVGAPGTDAIEVTVMLEEASLAALV